MDANKELVGRMFEQVFNERDLERCDEFFGREYVEHAVAPFGGEEPGSVIGPEHMRNVVTWLVDQYPDMTMRIESIVADDDMVAVLVWSEGTNLGRLNGVIPPTGKRFSGRQSHWYRVADGKLVEHWAVREDLSTMLQLGIITLPGPPG